MADKAGARADELLEQYVQLARSGRVAEAATLLDKCPAAQRDELRDAMAGFDLLWRNYEPFLVGPNLVQRAQSRIREASERKKRTADVRARLEAKPRQGPLTGGKLRDLLRAALGLSESWAGTSQSAPVRSPAFQFRGAAAGTTPRTVLDAATRALVERAAAAEAARVWRAAGTPDPPIDLQKIAEDIGLVVIEVALEDCDGCVATEGDLGVVILSSETQHEGRRRFTLAHEIGHYQLHRAFLHYLQESASQIESDWTQERELGANIFASELLMPTDLVTPQFGHQEPSFDAVDELAKRYGVSLTAAARRLVSVSDYAVALVYTRGEQVKWFAASSEFHLELRNLVGRMPPPNSDAASLVAGEEPPARFWPTPVSWWSSRPHVPGDDELLEASRRIYDDCILTLLYVRDTSGH